MPKLSLAGNILIFADKKDDKYKLEFIHPIFN